MSIVKLVRKMRSCDGDTAAQLLLENYLEKLGKTPQTEQAEASSLSALLSAKRIEKATYMTSCILDRLLIARTDDGLVEGVEILKSILTGEYDNT